MTGKRTTTTKRGARFEVVRAINPRTEIATSWQPFDNNVGVTGTGSVAVVLEVRPHYRLVSCWVAYKLVLITAA